MPEKPDLKPKVQEKIKVVCAWCPDKKEKEEEAMKRGFKISHGMCSVCEKKLEDELERLREKYSSGGTKKTS